MKTIRIRRTRDIHLEHFVELDEHELEADAIVGVRAPAWTRARGAPRLAAMSLHLFAGLRVRDFHAARPWYEQLLGEPTFFPHAREAVWTLAEHRSVYVVEDADGAGTSVATIFVDDLDAYLAAIAARGLEPDGIETYSNGVRKAVYRDPDGNELGFGGAPLDTGSST